MGETNTDFTVSFQDTGRYYSAASNYSLSLESAIIPNLEYNINQYNNKLYIRENNVTNLVATIPIKNYSAEQLRSELETQLNAASALTYTVSYVEQTKKYTFAVPLPDVFRILDGSNSINKAIGMQGESSLGAAVTSEFPIDLAGTPYVDLELMSVPNGNMHSAGSNQVFARIPINEPFGYYINYVNPDTSQSLRFSEDILYSLRIRLMRPDGKKLDIAQSADVSLVFKAAPIL